MPALTTAAAESRAVWRTLWRRIRRGLAPARHHALLRAALPIVVVVGVVALFFVQRQIDRRLELAALGCDPPASSACLGNVEPSGMTLELAGSARDVACQMRSASASGSAPSPKERVCIEARVQARWDDLTWLDARVLIPLYVLLTLLVSVWTALHGREGRRRWVAPAALVLAVLMAMADARENRATQGMLILVEATGAFGPESTVPLDKAAHFARQASMLKWAVAALWMVALAWSLWQWQGGDGWLSRVLRRLGIVAAAMAACIGALTVGVVLATADALDMAGPAQAVRAGFALGLLALLVVPIAAWVERPPGRRGRKGQPPPAQSGAARPRG